MRRLELDAEKLLMFLLMFTAVKAINKAVRFQNSKFTKMESRRNRQRKSKSSDYLSQFVTSNRKSDSERTKRFSGAFSFESSYTNRNPKLKYKKKGVRAEKGIGGGEKKNYHEQTLIFKTKKLRERRPNRKTLITKLRTNLGASS